MNLPFAILFIAIAGAAFYLLLRPDKVQSTRNLQLVWLGLALSLMWHAIATMAIMATGFESSGDMVAAAASPGIAYLFLGGACVALPLVVIPLELKAKHKNYVQPHRTGSSEFKAWGEGEEAPAGGA